jgi:hypothetical protein
MFSSGEVAGAAADIPGCAAVTSGLMYWPRNEKLLPKTSPFGAFNLIFDGSVVAAELSAAELSGAGAAAEAGAGAAEAVAEEATGAGAETVGFTLGAVFIFAILVT